MAKGQVEIEPIIARTDDVICGACEVCVELCPYGAISITGDDNVYSHAEINLCIM